ncbi:DUF6346 domain-containing protein [Actinoplanes sp. NPDC048796]|uniref:DUF6346 domain-containing protein n=1 Tax=Actinoplanes sp. NPDC048796 TaxID=3155640 RepID=UPI0033C855FE
MAEESERMRELRERMDRLQRATAPEPPPAADATTVSPVQPGSSGRLKAVLKLAGLVLSLVVIFQTAFTLMSLNGKDFDDARRVGQAKVESCERRGPVGVIYGYWDECLVSVEWNDGVHQRSYFDKPHLFHAGEVGTTVELGNNGYGRSGPTYSRPDFEPRPLLATLGIILFVVAAIPGVITIIALWSLAQGALQRLFRRR